ncbi:MAG TPA: radical SAM protein [Ignavibacteriales bacterium]|nr:radical SAM protein [Ignavibacteriales bacterium]
MKVLLVIPPFSQINTPYPSAQQLSGFLKSRGYEARTFDLSLASALKLFSGEGLRRIFSYIAQSGHKEDDEVRRALALSGKYISTIDPVINFLQGKNPNLAYRIVQEGFLPQGEAFSRDSAEISAFGYFSLQDKAKYYSSLYIDDITDIIARTITPHFRLSRYAEKLSQSPPHFDPVLLETRRPRNLIEEMMLEELKGEIEAFSPGIIGFTIPFPGNLLGALISAEFIKKNYPGIKIVFGGGYVNTELRTLRDERIFEFADYITYDDGELPLLNIIRNLEGEGSKFVRTLTRQKGKLTFHDDAEEKNLSHEEMFPPSLNGIDPSKYVPVTEMLNPMHRIWSDGYWNKLTAAHGCYWHKCTFCDISLDYIKRYSPARAVTIVDWMEDMIAQTGMTAFHFTDEAAPPALLKEISLEILRRRLAISWWGNIRFEKAFTEDLCRLMAQSGCIAVSGGLEVADERLLKLINKGVTLSQVARVCRSFRDSGIMVHAYLMFGFPTETEQELINSLELVRQFIKLNLFQSGFWHRFSLTAHSPIAENPAEFNIEVTSSAKNPFANNDLNYRDLAGIDHGKFSEGLSKALYNYMHGVGLDWDVTKWFEFRVPKSTIDKTLIRSFIQDVSERYMPDGKRRAVWTGSEPIIKKPGKGEASVTVHGNSVAADWKVNTKIADWLKQTAQKGSVNSPEAVTFGQLKTSFPGGEEAFNKFSQSEVWKELRDNILLFV